MASRSHDESGNVPAGGPVRVLLIDDEADTLMPTLAQNLEPMGFEFHKEASSASALKSVGNLSPDLILLDLHFPGDDRCGGRTTGGRLLTDIRGRFDSIPVVVFTTRLDDVDIPLEDFDKQPHQYFAKPGPGGGHEWVGELAAAMRNAIDTVRFTRDPDAGDLGFLVGQTPVMHQAAGLIRTAASNSMTVLIYGETGTGKQPAAEAIHKLSVKLSVRTGHFEHFNCPAVHDETLESKLFGHERGAFTGATAAMPGLFELADGGTLFLDEIQRMPMFLQDKLMLVVENGRVRRMGATQDRQVDVRLIVATNHSLADLVADGVLREDLAYRFASGTLIFLPPLRDRLVDLPEFFEMFVAKANKDLGKGVSHTLRPEVKAKLEAHAWGGNIRELESTIMRAVAHTNSNVLLPQDIEFVSVTRVIAKHQNTELGTTGENQPPIAAGSGSIEENGLEAQAAEIAAKIEKMPTKDRYGFFTDNVKGDLKKLVLIEIVRSIRKRQGTTVQHKQLARYLDVIKVIKMVKKDGQEVSAEDKKDFNRIRQMVIKAGVQLTVLDCNQ